MESHRRFADSLLTVVLAACIVVLGSTGSASAATSLIDDPVWGPSSVIHNLDDDQKFLRLDFTTPYTLNEIQGQLGPGEVFDGWRIATLNELEDLTLAHGITSGSPDPIQVAAAAQIRDWFCPAVTCMLTTGTSEYARGALWDLHPSFPGYRKVFSFGVRINRDPNEASAYFSGAANPDTRKEEIFLTAATMPEPVWLELRLPWVAPPGVPRVVAVMGFDGRNVSATDDFYDKSDLVSFGFDFGEGLVEFDTIDINDPGGWGSIGSFTAGRAEYGTMAFSGTESYSDPGSSPRDWDILTYEEPYIGQQDPFYFRLRDSLTGQNEPLVENTNGSAAWFRSVAPPTFIPVPGPPPPPPTPPAVPALAPGSLLTLALLLGSGAWAMLHRRGVGARIEAPRR